MIPPRRLKRRDSRPMKPCSEQSCWTAHPSTEEEEVVVVVVVLVEVVGEGVELLLRQWAQARLEEQQEWEARHREGDIGIGHVV